jgi:hypothetical protein
MTAANGIDRPTHLVAEPGDLYALCGVRDPLPVLWVGGLAAHLAARPSFTVCGACAIAMADQS